MRYPDGVSLALANAIDAFDMGISHGESDELKDQQDRASAGTSAT